MNALEISGLSYHYADGTPALSDLHFSVAAGDRVALIGANGAGKSTLLHHLNGLLPERLPVESCVQVCGKPVTRDSLYEIRCEVGLLFQDPDDQLFCPTVAEDVAFGPEQLGLSGQEIQQRVRESLSRVGLLGYENRAPHRLSRGEKRRVCLAGVLASGARVLALDEPSSDLDPRSRRELIHTLKSLPVTQIIATHDLELVVELCPRVLVMQSGRLVMQGETVAVLSQEQSMLEYGLEMPHSLRHQHPHS